MLHFESCPYTRWEEKFTHYAATTTSNKNLKAIPFDFYVDSIKCCRQHAQAPPPAPAPTRRVRVACCRCVLRILRPPAPAVYPLPTSRAVQDPSRLRSFWRKRKQRHYLREADSLLVVGHIALSQESRERLERQRLRETRTARSRSSTPSPTPL